MKNSNQESLKINELSEYSLDTINNSWGDFKELTLTPQNITKIWKKQCEIIEVVNKILDAKVLIK